MGVPLTPLAQHVWETRYRARKPDGYESSIEDTWRRVAQAVAATEPASNPYAQAFYELLSDFKFLPGGRILAGAGTTRAVTLANCFVMGPLADSLVGIFETLKEAALTMQQGGGVGYDFSTLRPRGTRAADTGSTATGPVSFMHVFDSACATVAATGARRGAMMATLRCDHPDILEFVRAKHNPRDLTHFNLSVLATDAFVHAARHGSDWPLAFPTAAQPTRVIAARELWDTICSAAHSTGEPGLLFLDRINSANNLAYRETLTATNPCGEAPLPEYGACHLGSLNLVRFVRHAFEPQASIDFMALAAAAQLAVRFLDDVIEISRYPLFRQAQRARATRRIGLGITGLGDALAMLGLHYATEQAREMARQIMTTVRDAAYESSIDLARVRGAFADIDLGQHLQRPFIRSLPATLQHSIREHGVRNSHLLAIAPAGTISLLADNVSSGIEPIFAQRSSRRVIDASGEPHQYIVEDHAYRQWRATHDSCPPAAALVESHALTAHSHLAMQAALQPLVDGAISKTIVLPPSAGIDTVSEIFFEAHALELKGCTAYRIGSRDDVIAKHVEREAPDDARAAPYAERR
jgi:ribonucleoside-diphosphate reductase alpha chain